MPKHQSTAAKRARAAVRVSNAKYTSTLRGEHFSEADRELQDRLVEAAALIRDRGRVANDIGGFSGDTAGRVYHHHADVLEDQLNNAPANLRNEPTKALADWEQQLAWKHGNTSEQEQVKAAAYVRDIATLRMVLCQDAADQEAD
ncbi:hypothetical protein ACWDRB_47290 [Nonomuraea sp. NPDC003707]